MKFFVLVGLSQNSIKIGTLKAKMLNTALFEKYVGLAKQMLECLCLQSNINYSSYSWVDVCGGQYGMWSIALSSLSKNKVTLVDSEPPTGWFLNQCESNNVQVVQGEVSDIQLSGVLAVFIRTSLSYNFLNNFLDHHPSVVLVVFCPIFGGADEETLASNFKQFTYRKIVQVAEPGMSYLSGPRSQGIKNISSVKDLTESQTKFYIFVKS